MLHSPFSYIRCALIADPDLIYRVRHGIFVGLASAAVVGSVFSAGQKIHDLWFGADSSSSIAATPVEEFCGQFEKHQFTYTSSAPYISPNIWNLSGPHQTVCVELAGGDAPATKADPWVFNWELPNEHVAVIAYPEVVAGQLPWDNPPSGRFVSPLSSADVDLSYAYSVQSTGTYSAFASTWLLDKPNSTKDNIVSEVVLWVESTDQAPGGILLDSEIQIDGATWDLWADADGVTPKGGSRGWDYFAFVRHDKQRSGTASIDAFTDYLVAKGYTQADHYLASVEFGFELYDGVGSADVTHFEVTGLPDARVLPRQRPSHLTEDNSGFIAAILRAFN